MCLKPCTIGNCGEFQPGQDFGLFENDGTDDIFANFPEDSDLNFNDVRNWFLIF